MRFLLAGCLLAAATAHAEACTFCADGLAGRQPLSHHYAAAKFVAFGTLKNPRPAPDGLGGTTEFHVATIHKATPAFAATTVVVLPRYIPVIGDTPPEYLLFALEADGKLDPLHGTPTTTAVSAYLRDAAKLNRADAAALGFFFRKLDDADAAIAADAFVEFARAGDRDIQKAAPHLNRLKIRAWLTDPKTSEERVGVYAMMLGLCGTHDDAAWLAALLNRAPLADRYASNLGGLLAGLTLLDAASGWKQTQAALADAKLPIASRLSAVNTLRYFQATREKECKPQLLACYAKLLDAGDFADMAADDLRRFGWWDLTATVLAGFDKPTHKAPAVRRGILRYALGCPDDAAKAFVVGVRAKEPALVKKVEDGLKLYGVK